MLKGVVIMTKKVEFIREQQGCRVVKKTLKMELREGIVIDIDPIDVCRFSDGRADSSRLTNRIDLFVKRAKEEKDGTQLWFVTCDCALDYKIPLLLKNFGRKISFHFLTTEEEFNENITDFIQCNRNIKALIQSHNRCSCEDDLPEKILQRMILER